MILLQIDGSQGEGGGQIIRTSLTLSAITQIPFRLFNIRPNRKPKPHLQSQHLMAALAVKEITNGQLENAEIGSAEFIFYPKVIKAGNYEFNIQTAGASVLVAQTIIPILLNAHEPSIVRIIGGTNVPLSPAFDYFQQIFLKAIHLFGANVSCHLIRSGYFPKGNGIIEIQIHPTKLNGVTAWPETKKINSIIRIANLPRSIAEREEKIIRELPLSNLEIIEEQTLSPGNVITIWQDFKGVNALGRPGLLAEKVAKTALTDFVQEAGDVDRHLADQLLIYAVLAKGKTYYRTSTLTNHLYTNQYIISQFLKRNIAMENNSVRVK